MSPESIQPLIHRHLDGTATPEEASRLALALLDDPAAARAFAHATRLEAELRTCFQSESVGRRLAEAVRFESSQRRQPRSRAWAAAAAALIVAGLSWAWWRPGRPVVQPEVVAENPRAVPRAVAEGPAHPPSLRRPGALSPGAAAVKRLVARYWLPDAIEFAGTPLAEAVAVVQQRAATVNHRKNGLIAAFAVDVPEELADQPITASRADLPLGAWWDLLSAQVGCELRFTDTGVAFDPVERPDVVETRRFPLPSVAATGDADAPGNSDAPPSRLFSYAHPWDEQPLFGSIAPHGAALATAWGIPATAATRVLVKDGETLEVRHHRRELRRIEGLLAVAAADAGRPMVTFRAQEVPLPMVAQAEQVLAMDDYGLNLSLAPEVTEFEGFINYTPINTTTTVAKGKFADIVLTVASQPVASGNRVVSNDEAAGLIRQPTAITWALPMVREWQGSVHFTQPIDTPDPATLAANVMDGVTMLSTQVAWEFNAIQEAAPDPWQQTVRTSARLGEAAAMATTVPQEFTPDGEILTVGFSLLDMQPKPLAARAQLEGEMIKLTGAYTPPDGGSPTDFQAYVGEGQSFVLQTEDVPSINIGAEPMGNTFLLNRMDEHEFFLTSTGSAPEIINGRIASWQESAVEINDLAIGEYVRVEQSTIHITRRRPWSASATAPTVRGVVISPVLEWPAVPAR